MGLGQVMLKFLSTLCYPKPQISNRVDCSLDQYCKNDKQGIVSILESNCTLFHIHVQLPREPLVFNPKEPLLEDPTLAVHGP